MEMLCYGCCLGSSSKASPRCPPLLSPCITYFLKIRKNPQGFPSCQMQHGCHDESAAHPAAGSSGPAWPAVLSEPCSSEAAALGSCLTAWSTHSLVLLSVQKNSVIPATLKPSVTSSPESLQQRNGTFLPNRSSAGQPGGHQDTGAKQCKAVSLHLKSTFSLLTVLPGHMQGNKGGGVGRESPLSRANL